MAFYKATIEVLIDVANEAEACDAISETMRPVLKEFTPESCVIDWRYSESHSVPTPDTGAGFEYAEGFAV